MYLPDYAWRVSAGKTFFFVLTCPVRDVRFVGGYPSGIRPALQSPYSRLRSRVRSTGFSLCLYKHVHIGVLLEFFIDWWARKEEGGGIWSKCCGTLRHVFFLCFRVKIKFRYYTVQSPNNIRYINGRVKIPWKPLLTTVNTPLTVQDYKFNSC